MGGCPHVALMCWSPEFSLLAPPRRSENTIHLVEAGARHTSPVVGGGILPLLLLTDALVGVGGRDSTRREAGPLPPEGKRSCVCSSPRA
jgi:hypothetical protein